MDLGDQKLLFFSHCQIVCNAKFTRETRTKYVPYTNGQTHIIEQLNFAYFSWFCLPVVMRSWRNAWQTFLSWQTTCVAFPNHSTYSFIKLNYPCCTVGTTSFFVMNRKIIESKAIYCSEAKSSAKSSLWCGSFYSCLVFK